MLALSDPISEMANLVGLLIVIRCYLELLCRTDAVRPKHGPVGTVGRHKGRNGRYFS